VGRLLAALSLLEKVKKSRLSGGLLRWDLRLAWLDGGTGLDAWSAGKLVCLQAEDEGEIKSRSGGFTTCI